MSPWIFGLTLFVIYIVAQLVVSWMFGDGLAAVYFPAVLAGAFVFAGVATGLQLTLKRYANPEWLIIRSNSLKAPSAEFRIAR